MANLFRRLLRMALPPSLPSEIIALTEKERFTDRSLHILRLALQISARWNHEYIGTEHLLLALLEEGTGVGAYVLKQLIGDLGRAKQKIERLMISGPPSVYLGAVPFTPRAIWSLQAAVDEARRLNHQYVGSEHLLLGLLQDRSSLSHQTMFHLGIDLEAVRSELSRVMGIRDDVA